MNWRELVAEANIREGEFLAWDEMAVEVEVAEFLYGLVRAMKPELIVEAGSGKGYASWVMAYALQCNKKGALITYDQDPRFALEAAAKLAWLPAQTVVGFSYEYEDELPDLVFIDTLGELREQDIDFWLGRGPMIVVHDANDFNLPDGVLITSGRGLWIGH